MKRYKLSFGDSLFHAPAHPERTAKRNLEWDVEFQVWASRPAMAKTIRMQQKRSPIGNRQQWTACVPLTDGEGF